jgi:hypothetical protein
MRFCEDDLARQTLPSVAEAASRRLGFVFTSFFV